MSKQVQIDTPVGKPASSQPQPVDLVLRLHQLEGSTQAVACGWHLLDQGTS